MFLIRRLLQSFCLFDKFEKYYNTELSETPISIHQPTIKPQSSLNLLNINKVIDLQAQRIKNLKHVKRGLNDCLRYPIVARAENANLNHVFCKQFREIFSSQN